LHDAGWAAEPLGDLAILVPLGPVPSETDRGEDELVDTLRTAGHAPRWTTSADDASLTLAAAAPTGPITLPGDD
jgi:hypothetical protein